MEIRRKAERSGSWSTWWKPVIERSEPQTGLTFTFHLDNDKETKSLIDPARTLPPTAPIKPDRVWERLQRTTGYSQILLWRLVASSPRRTEAVTSARVLKMGYWVWIDGRIFECFYFSKRLQHNSKSALKKLELREELEMELCFLVVRLYAKLSYIHNAPAADFS